MGSSKQTTTSSGQQTTTAAPPTWTAPGLNDVAARVTAAADNLPTSHYSGPMIAQMDPTQLKAITDAWGATSGNATALAGQLQGSMPILQQIAGGQLGYNTALPGTSINLGGPADATAAIRAAIAPVNQQLTEQTLPSIVNSALSSGAYSNDRAMGVMPEQAIRDAQASMQNIAGTLGYQAYNDWQNRSLTAQEAQIQAAQQNYGLDTSRVQGTTAQQLQALGLAPEYVNSILHTQASAGDLLNMAAQLQQQQGQLGINDSLARDQYAASSPFMGLDTASALLAQLSGRYGTDTTNMNSTQTTVQQANPVTTALQAAMGIGGMIAGIPGLGGGGAATSALGSGASAANLFSAAPSIAGAAPLASVAAPNWGQIMASLPGMNVGGTVGPRP